ncbi:MAG TPA: hypothetical protein VK474_12365 [Chthoniobacterales bacterium]|nr:hypothetical protein [Chthoniobacterales bacterium]
MTLTELTRLKVFYVLLLFALALIASSTLVARLGFQEEFQVLKDVSLGAMGIFSSLLAIVATARLLPQDQEDRTVYTILARPVPRFEYVAGKLLGVLLLLALSLLAMSALFFLLLYFREQSALAETARQMSPLPPEQLSAALDAVRRSVFTANLLPGIVIIFFKAGLLASLTLFISTFASTSLFSIVLAVFVYFIGHLQATAREFWLQEHGAAWFGRTFFALVALIFPDLQLFDFSDEIVVGAGIPLLFFLQIAALGAFYIVIYLLLAIAVFTGKEL